VSLEGEALASAADHRLQPWLAPLIMGVAMLILPINGADTAVAKNGQIRPSASRACALFCARAHPLGVRPRMVPVRGLSGAPDCR
jgi:hypothetical protein